MIPSRIALFFSLSACLCLLHSPAYAKHFFVDSLNGNDSNTGTAPANAWKTLARINSTSFDPGDTILFKRGQKWRGTLDVSASGTDNNIIKYGAYDIGPNPVIMRTRQFSNWSLYSERHSQGTTAKIWYGVLPGLKNSWGLVKDGLRTPLHRQYSGIAINVILNGHFYCPLNRSRFYFRNDSGNPGTAEIGFYSEAIRIMNRHHIVIDSIDAFGPGGRHDSGSATGSSTVSIGKNSTHIRLQNLSVSFGNSIGIKTDSTTHDIAFVNLDVHDNAGTGIYMNSKGGSIYNCRSHDNGRVYTDKGDRGGIGSYRGSDITIESNEVFRNGSDNADADFEISIVGTGPIKVQRNYIHDCLQGCVQIAEGGDNSLIAYNIISRYGTARGKKPSQGKFSGIRIGGGGSGSKDIHIFNNVLHGGQQSVKTREAALFVAPFDNTDLIVKNNIFAYNTNKNIYISSSAKLGNAEFSNNLFSDHSNDIDWTHSKFHSLKQWQTTYRQGRNSRVGPPLFTNLSGSFSKSNDFMLKPGSPAIDSGVDTGIRTDYKGNPVPLGIRPDMGAFEYRPSD